MKTKQPVIQLDYAFLGDNSENPQVTLVTAIDLLSGLGLSRVVPSKGRSVYAQAQLRRFVLETGRTFGILQIDPEPSLKALVAKNTLLRLVDLLFATRQPAGSKHKVR